MMKTVQPNEEVQNKDDQWRTQKLALKEFPTTEARQSSFLSMSSKDNLDDQRADSTLNVVVISKKPNLEQYVRETSF